MKTNSKPKTSYASLLCYAVRVAIMAAQYAVPVVHLVELLDLRVLFCVAM